MCWPLRTQFLLNSHTRLCDGPSAKLLSACRPTLTQDPLFWLPMTHIERSRVLRWRLGWLPGGVPKPCLYHPESAFTRDHTIECLHMHSRLQLPFSIADPLSFLLSKLPLKKPRATQNASAWFVRWPAICIILHEMDYLFHAQVPPPPQDPGIKLTNWLSS